MPVTQRAFVSGYYAFRWGDSKAGGVHGDQWRMTQRQEEEEEEEDEEEEEEEVVEEDDGNGNKTAVVWCGSGNKREYIE